QRVERGGLRRAVDALLRRKACAEPHYLAQRIERIDLPVDDAADLQVKAVRSEVDGGERVVACHSRHHSRIRELRSSRNRHTPTTGDVENPFGGLPAWNSKQGR